MFVCFVLVLVGDGLSGFVCLFACLFVLCVRVCLFCCCLFVCLFLLSLFLFFVVVWLLLFLIVVVFGLFVVVFVVICVCVFLLFGLLFAQMGNRVHSYSSLLVMGKVVI